MKPSLFVEKFSSFIPDKEEIKVSLKTGGMILLGAVLLTPLAKKLPMLGWDWYYFFLGHNPDYHLLSPTSAYPPFTHFFIQLFAWMDWRDSLALINSITLLTLALATWRTGGRYGSIFFVLFSPCVWFLMYSGHPDALAFFGMFVGFVPLGLIKPQLTIWYLFLNRKYFFWIASFLAVSLIVWPLWPLRFRAVTVLYEPAFGWTVTGWPVALFGALMFVGAGNDLYRLMSAGFLMSPYLMPYNLALLMPALGNAKGYSKILIWVTSWLVVLATGLGGQWRALNLIFLVVVYWSDHSLAEYQANVLSLYNTCIGHWRRFRRGVEDLSAMGGSTAEPRNK